MPQPQRARLYDLAALVFIAAGAWLCIVANDRMTELAKLSYLHPGPRGQSALAAADRARYMTYGGIAMIVLGCGLGVVGAVKLAADRRQMREDEADPSLRSG